jgi:DNA-binding beta-propeller fold protein YncE
MWANHQGKVQIVDMTGHVLADIENNTKGEKLFKCPNYLTINSYGTVLYVSDWYRDCISAINLENLAVKELRHRFWHPEGITTDKEGLLYICECGTNRIHVFHPEDNISPPDVLLEDTSANWQPLAVCYSLSDRKLYVSQYGLDFIKVYEINDCVTSKN